MKDSNLKKRVIKNSFWSFMASMLNRVGALIFTIVLARFLMPENYGIYSIVLSAVMVFHSFADLGINNALIRYLSYSLAKNKKQVPAYYRYLLKLKLALTLIVFFILIILIYPLTFYVFKNPKLLFPFIAGAFYFIIISLESFHVSVLFSIEKFNMVTIKESITQALRIGAVFLVFFFVAAYHHVFGIYLSLITIHTFIVLLVIYYLKKVIPILYKYPEEKINKSKVIRFVKFLTIASISGIFFSYVDSLIIGFFLLPEYVGYYRAAFSLILGITGFIAFPNIILLPLFTKENKVNSQELLNKTLKYISIIAVPASFGLASLASYFVFLFFGAEYLPFINESFGFFSKFSICIKLTYF